MQELINYLFETKAIRVCPKGKPFWYTSGKIGPYYINTHFLFGGEKAANVFLEEIDRLKVNKTACSEEFHRIVKENYSKDPVYKGTIDIMVEYIRQNINVEDIDYISGGERRDWFFSFMIADILAKPHITLFKDASSVIYENGASFEKENIEKASVLHIADLITSASSYERAWVPAIEKINGVMKWSLVVVDRLQGGGELLEKLNVNSHALVFIDKSVFRKAFEKGYIDADQLDLVLKYIDDPEGFIDSFLKENPDFISESLKEGRKTAERAKLLLKSLEEKKQKEEGQ
ncbi:MAG: orotate phosphoribosyltransferase [Clostridiaceae bacterium]|nr:orotate phosphoribosyltransferase [Clostridiaceae bacterium]